MPASFRIPADPRWLQIAFLTSFLGLGVLFAGLEVPVWEPPLVVGTALLTQYLCVRLKRGTDLGLLSASITGLGLTLLLRTDEPILAAAAAAFAISSKFVLRIKGKHVFNPTCLGLAVFMLATPHVWCSPSQWGEDGVLYAWFVALGLAVVVRALRSDVSFAFLGAWILLKLGRVLYLGQRPQVLLHQLTVGSLVLFTFFMISDPRTTPSSRRGRLFFAAAVAVLAFTLQHSLWWQNTPVWALFILSPLVPLLDRLFPATAYAWPTRSSSQEGTAPCLPSTVISSSH